MLVVMCDDDDDDDDDRHVGDDCPDFQGKAPTNKTEQNKKLGTGEESNRSEKLEPPREMRGIHHIMFHAHAV